MKHLLHDEDGTITLYCDACGRAEDFQSEDNQKVVDVIHANLKHQCKGERP